MGYLHSIFITALCLLGLNADTTVSSHTSLTKWLFKRNAPECSGAEYYLCKSGECLVKYSLCDSVVDCADRSDEAAAVCLALYKGRCQSNQWKCAYGACIKESKRCDQKVDCWDGSDEENCPVDTSDRMSSGQDCNCTQNEVVNKKKKYYINKYKTMNWFEAFLYCQNHYTRMATVASKEDNDNVVEAIEREFPGQATFLWVGGADIAREGVWSWMTTGRQIVDTVDYTNWDLWQPDNHNNSEHCLAYWKSSDVYKWNDGICGHINFFICEHFE